MATANGKQRSEPITLTPKMASEWLSKMKHNRRLRSSQVDFLTEIILNEDFILSTDPVMFDQEGNLVNGQHRCWACVMADKPIQVRVLYDVTPEEVAVIDTNISRDYRDAAHYAGAEASIMNGALAKMMVMGPMTKRRKIPHSITRDWYEFYKDGIDFANRLRGSNRIAGTKPWTVSMTTAMARAYYSEEPEQLERFAKVVATGQKEFDSDRAAVTLRDTVLTKRMGTLETEQYFKTEAAIRAFIERRPISKLQAVDAEIFPVPKLPMKMRYRQTNTKAKIAKVRATMAKQ